MINQIHCPIDVFVTNRIRHRPDFFRILSHILTGSCGDILRDIHENRAGTPTLRDGERPADRIRKFRDVFYDHAVFCDRHRDARDIDLLEAVASQQSFRDIRRDRDDRDRIHVRRRDARHQICRARAARRHTDLAGRSRITVRRMRRALLMGRQHMADLRVFIEFIIDIQDRTARISEHGVDALLFQTFDDDL